MPRLAAALAVVCALGAASGDARAGDVRRRWRTIESAHFVIHYYEPLGDVAHRVAVCAERAHRTLAPALGHAPAQKTQIVIVDDTDSANGFANVVPRNTIHLFATAPEWFSSLNDHDDWLYGLVAHEYTHILHLDTIGGLPAVYNRVVGKTWAPNQVEPRWVIEGIAVYEESKRSSSGRNRSAIFDMYLRVPVLAGAELDLAAVSSGPRAWPHGNAAYLYGSHFLAYVFSRYGDDKLAAMSRTYGADPVPFGINRAIKRATGATFVDAYDAWRAYMRDKYTLDLEAIERRGRIEGRQLTWSGETNSEPRYSRDGRLLIWLQADGYRRAGYRAMPAGGDPAAAFDYASIDGASAFDILSDGSLVVERTTIYRNDYDYQDLYLWDHRTGRLRALTHGLRARDPAVSRDERMVAFTINGESHSKVAVMPLRQEAAHRVVWEGAGRWDQASTPAWSPDGSHLAFSVWREGGARDIVEVELATGAAREITHDRALDGDPAYSPDGRWLFFTSERTGVYDVYAYEVATGALHQVTNVVGCAVTPDVSPDGRLLVYQGFDVRGFELYELPLDPARWLEPALYTDDRPEPTRIADDEAEVSTPRPYRPLATLAPHNYRLSLATDSFGSALSLDTSGSDVAGLHAYSIGTTIGLTRGDIGLGASYSYRRLWPTLRLAAARRLSQPTGLVIDTRNHRYVEDAYSVTASADLPVLRVPRASSSLSIEYDLDWLRALSDPFPGYDPSQAMPRFPETDVSLAGLALRWRYSDVRDFNYTVGPRDGTLLVGSLRYNEPAIGSDFRSLELGYRWENYRKLPWGETPTLALRLSGGIVTTDRRRSGGFSLGGVPNQDIPSAIIDGSRAGITGYLHGYRGSRVAGHQFHLLNLEYRQLLWEVEEGVTTVPLFVRRVHAAALFDAGNAFDGGIDLRDFKTAIGASLRLDLIFGWYQPGSLDLGIARGLASDGETELWMLLTSSL